MFKVFLYTPRILYNYTKYVCGYQAYVPTVKNICSALAEMVTFGKWEPKFRKINAIETKLKTSSSSVTRENYQRELESVQCLYDAQIILTRGVSVSSERSMMDVNMGF